MFYVNKMYLGYFFIFKKSFAYADEFLSYLPGFKSKSGMRVNQIRTERNKMVLRVKHTDEVRKIDVKLVIEEGKSQSEVLKLLAIPC